MATQSEWNELTSTMARLRGFVEERFNPVESRVDLMSDEQKRLSDEVINVQERMREIRRRDVDRAADSEYRLVVPNGPYAGLDPIDLRLIEGIALSQARETDGAAWAKRAADARRAMMSNLSADPGALRSMAASAERTMRARFPDPREYEKVAHGMLSYYEKRAAMDSTTSGSGSDLVVTLEARRLWMDVNLRTQVAQLIPTIPMPSNPFDVPTQLGDVNFYPGAQNTASSTTALSTGKTTLNAYELVGQTAYSYTLEEDAVIAVLPEIRAGLVRNVAEVLDDIILNADTTTTNNINADGATIATTDAGKAHWLVGYDGLLHLPLVDNTSQANDHNGAVSDDMFNEVRALLGKYGVRPSELIWIMDVNTFIRSQSIANFRTMDKLGPNATILTGMLGSIEGIPVIVSEQMKLADTDGKVTDAGNGTNTGRVLAVNRSQWFQGFRREMNIDVDRDNQKRQTVVTVSFRHALSERSGTRSTATHTSLQYDITGVA